ncbi:galactokinase family protein [Caproicibacter fermentans]|uniref:galactokinase family protein n=1 Tax=Caproicibacter fermentans TaxID=2576756 RepID=UPI001E5F22EF|nr:galactokinase family protein [Caproicibacter fermentans]
MKSSDTGKVLGEKKFRETLKERYGVGEERAETCRLRLLRAVEKFEELFGADREIRVYSAPGRTEIGGNHTDHQGGAFSRPASIWTPSAWQAPAAMGSRCIRRAFRRTG